MLSSFCPKESTKTKTYTITITTSIHCQLKVEFNSLLVFKDFILLKRCRAPPSTVPLHLSLLLFNLCILCPSSCWSVSYLYFISVLYFFFCLKIKNSGGLRKCNQKVGEGRHIEMTNIPAGKKCTQKEMYTPSLSHPVNSQMDRPMNNFADGDL